MWEKKTMILSWIASETIGGENVVLRWNLKWVSSLSDWIIPFHRKTIFLWNGIRTTKTVNGVKHTYALSGTTILNEEWTENGVQHLLMYVYDANGFSFLTDIYETNSAWTKSAQIVLIRSRLRWFFVCIFYNALRVHWKSWKLK